MTMPCGCCPIPTETCFEASTQLPFESVAVTNPGGHSIVNMNSTIDGTMGSDLSGFVPPVSQAQLDAAPGTLFDYIFAAPFDNVNRLFWFNGGGGVLTDQDGFGVVTFDLLSPTNAVLYTSTWDLGPPVGNNNITRMIAFPQVDNVKTIRFRNFHKQNINIFGSGAPLLRQVQAFQVTARPVFPCRNRSAPNTVRWFDTEGNEVPAVIVQPCDSI